MYDGVNSTAAMLSVSKVSCYVYLFSVILPQFIRDDLLSRPSSYKLCPSVSLTITLYMMGAPFFVFMSGFEWVILHHCYTKHSSCCLKQHSPFVSLSYSNRRKTCACCDSSRKSTPPHAPVHYGTWRKRQTTLCMSSPSACLGRARWANPCASERPRRPRPRPLRVKVKWHTPMPFIKHTHT